MPTLPDDASLKDVQYSVYVRERIERARRELNQGNLIEHEIPGHPRDDVPKGTQKSVLRAAGLGDKQ